MDELQKQTKLAASDLINMAGTPVSVAARAGAPKPDLGAADAFKPTLLNAQSFLFADPAKGGASGIHFARVLALPDRQLQCALRPRASSRGEIRNGAGQRKQRSADVAGSDLTCRSPQGLTEGLRRDAII